MDAVAGDCYRQKSAMTTTQRCECLCLRTAHHNSGPCRNCQDCDGWAPMVELPYDNEDET